MKREINQPFTYRFLPRYARFLLDNKLKEYVRRGIDLSTSLNLPVLKYFRSMSDEELFQHSIVSTTAFLKAMEENTLSILLNEAMERWKTGQLPLISKDQLIAEDITLASYIRKNVLLHFIPDYTKDIEEALGIINEVDQYIQTSELAAFNLYITIQQEKINDHVSSIEKINEKLNESERLHLQAQAITHIGNWTWDIQDNTVMWSDEMYRIYGLKPQSIPINYDVFLSRVYPDDRPLINEHISKILNDHIPFDFFHRILLPDNSVKIIQARAETARDHHGNATHLIGTTQDVTSQRTIESELIEKQNFIQKIIHITPSLVAVYNVHTGKYIFINNALKQLLGFDSQMVLDEGVNFFMERLHPEDVEALVKKNTDALVLANTSAVPEEEDLIEFEYRLRHKNGEYRRVHTYGSIFDRNTSGAVEHVINITVDVTEEYLLRKQLEDEKAFAELLVENSPYLILTYDRDLRITTWNKKSEDYTGKKKKDVLGRFAFDVFPEYNNDKWKNMIAEVMGGKSIHYPKIPFYNNKGYAESFVVPLKNKNGEVIGLLSITQDITKIITANETLEKTNEELRRSEDRYHKMISDVEDYAIILLSRDGIIENWNKGAENIKGYKAEEIIGKHFSIFYTEEDKKNNLPETLIKTTIQKGKGAYEGWRLRKDGTRFWGSIAITALYTEDRELIGFSKVTRDLTERKTAEDSLRLYADNLERKNKELEGSYAELRKARVQLADDRTAVIVNAMPNIVALVNLRGELNFCNQLMLDYTGMSYDELNNRGWISCIYEEDIKNLTLVMEKSLKNGDEFRSDLRLRRADGEFLWHHALARPFKNEKGKSDRWIVTLINIHNQKLIDEKKDEFLGIASHELKTPLTSAKAYIELAGNIIDPDVSKEASYYVQKAGSSLNKLNTLVSELLDITRIQHGKLSFNLSEFDFNEMIDDSIDVIRPSTKQKILREGSRTKKVHGDRERLQQVVINLLSNAIKYSPDAEQVEVKVKLSKKEVMVSVTDHGIGIPKSDIKKIFSRFYRVEHNAQQFQGMGIGLFISEQIILRHKGKIWVESIQGKGSTFYFTIPATLKAIT